MALFSPAWNLFKPRWKILALIAIIPSLVMYLGRLGLSSGSISFAVLGGILSVAGLVLSVALQPGMMDAVRVLSANPQAPLTVKGQYKTGFAFFWPLVYLSILQGFIFMGSAIFFILPAIAIAGYISVCVYSCVLDGKRGFDAFLDSFSLIRGRWWSVVGRLVSLSLTFAVSSLISVGAVFIVGGVLGFSTNSVAGTNLADIMSLIVNAALMPIAVAYLYNLYLSLKAARDASVSAASFKKWLTAALWIGVVVSVLILLVFISLALAPGSLARP